MTAETPKVGIVLTAGYTNKTRQIEASAELGVKFTPRAFDVPNSAGTARLMAGYIALKHGLVDKLVVSGRMPDDEGTASEIGHVEQLRLYTGREDNRILLPTNQKETLWTKDDLEQTLKFLKEQGIDKHVTIISDQAHLYPRTFLIKHLLGYPQAKLVSSESLLKIGRENAKQLNPTLASEISGIPIPTEYGSLRDYLTYELPITTVLALDLIPDRRNRGSEKIRQMARQAVEQKSGLNQSARRIRGWG